MIELTRLNGNPLYVNCDLIKWAEAAPDTLLTLVNGEKVVVRESCQELVDRVHKHRLLLLSSLLQLMPEPAAFLRAVTAAGVPGPCSRANPETSRTNPETWHEDLRGHRGKAGNETTETG
jgi:flagellar protein FlbD